MVYLNPGPPWRGRITISAGSANQPHRRDQVASDLTARSRRAHRWPRCYPFGTRPCLMAPCDRASRLSLRLGKRCETVETGASVHLVVSHSHAFQLIQLERDSKCTRLYTSCRVTDATCTAILPTAGFASNRSCTSRRSTTFKETSYGKSQVTAFRLGQWLQLLRAPFLYLLAPPGTSNAATAYRRFYVSC
jgi:hypothetical protein